ncbi:hypothetical protein HDU93_006646 [Gonapodya sp. JEL0774]|nr:hypothetical protein HDU93_006646 [Gonapodya sp. JEL0774]
MITAVRGWNGVAVPANKSQRKRIKISVPGVDPSKGPYPEDQRIVHFISTFLPHFIYLSPIVESKEERIHKFTAASAHFLAVNPGRIVNVYPESDSNGERTVVDLEHDVAGVGDNASGQTVYQVIVGRRIDEVVRAIVGDQSYRANVNNLSMFFVICGHIVKEKQTTATTDMSRIGALIRNPLTPKLVAAAAISLQTLGLRQVLGIFNGTVDGYRANLSYMAQDVHSQPALVPIQTSLGWGRSVFSLNVALLMLSWGFSGPFFSIAQEKNGAGKVLLFGGVSFILGFVCYALAGQIGKQGFPATGVFLGLGTGAAGVAVILAEVGRYFVVDEPLEGESDTEYLERKREAASQRVVAMAIVSSIGQAGQFIYAPVGRWIIATWGYEAEHAMDSTKEVDMLIVLLFRIPAYLQDKGVSGSDAAWSISVIGIGSTIGALVVGFIPRWFPYFTLRRTLAVIYYLRAVSIGAFLVIPVTVAGAMAFSFIIGTLWLTTVPLTTGVIANRHGTKYMGTLSAISLVGHQVFAFMGTYLGGIEYDLTGR